MFGLFSLLSFFPYAEWSIWYRTAESNVSPIFLCYYHPNWCVCVCVCEWELTFSKESEKIPKIFSMLLFPVIFFITFCSDCNAFDLLKNHPTNAQDQPSNWHSLQLTWRYQSVGDQCRQHIFIEPAVDARRQHILGDPLSHWRLGANHWLFLRWVRIARWEFGDAPEVV